MSKLPSSKEIYDRIRWDPGLDGRWITLGIEDRELGMQELPFSAFVEGGDIPFHRIQYFRCGDTVIWDRRTRTDLLCGIRRTPVPPPARPVQPPRRFGSREALQAHLRASAGTAWVLVRLSPEYPSFVQEVRLHSRLGEPRVRLSSEWRSYAMDWMGDATHVRVEYEFETLDAALDYIQRHYHCSAADFTAEPPPLPEGTPIINTYPDPLVPVFQDGWRRLKADFAAGRLTEEGLQVVSRFGGY